MLVCIAGFGESGRALHICWAGKSARSTGCYSFLLRFAGGDRRSYRVVKSDNHIDMLAGRAHFLFCKGATHPEEKSHTSGSEHVLSSQINASCKSSAADMLVEALYVKGGDPLTEHDVWLSHS